MSMVRMLMLAVASLVLTACGGGAAPTSTLNDWSVSSGSVSQPTMEYRIGALDKLNVTVFQVADLTLKDVQVDAVGNLQLPLVGTVVAKGKTTAELTEVVRSRLAQSYLQNPQVTITVSSAASQKVTVDGAVTTPGVYQMTGNTTLIQAVAMARGPTRTAELSRVAVFRNIDGQRQVALFDLRAIRRGQAEDPQILGDDVVVVDSSVMSSTIANVLGALPSLAIFRPF